MVELGVVGAKNSGKTTVIEGLLGYLVDHGIRVATIKHTSHSHRFDTPGKDSYRHKQAGALLTMAVSNEETAVFAAPDMIKPDQLQSITGQQIDLWLVEGDRTSDRPKLLVTRQLDDLSDELPNHVVATIGPEKVSGIPVHFDSEDYQGLGSFVIETILRSKGERQ